MPFKVFLLLSFLQLNLSVLRAAQLERVPRTRVSIVPPKGYKHFPTTQIYSNGRHQLQVLESVGESYRDSVKVYTNEKFASLGVNVIERIDFVVSDYPATFLLSDLPGRANGFIMSFGDSSRIIVISGTAEFENEDDRIEFIAALLLTQYDPSIVLKPYDDLHFIPDTVNTNFKLVKFTATSLIYTPNGKLIRPGIIDPSVTVLTGYNEKELPVERSFDAFLDLMRMNGFYAYMADSSHLEKQGELETLLAFGKCFYEDRFIFSVTYIQQKENFPLAAQGFCFANDTEAIKQITEFCLAVKY